MQSKNHQYKEITNNSLLNKYKNSNAIQSSNRKNMYILISYRGMLRDYPGKSQYDLSKPLLAVMDAIGYYYGISSKWSITPIF